MHIHAYTCSPSLNHLVIPDTLHHIQESKEGKDKELYGFILIKHSLITWFHCCNISIISLYWIIQNVFLNKHASSIPTCEERQAGVQTYFRQQAPSGITHLSTTHSYKRAGCASLERLGSCCFYLNWIGSKGLEATQAKAALWSIGRKDSKEKVLWLPVVCSEHLWLGGGSFVGLVAFYRGASFFLCPGLTPLYS